ncbi:preprotein translocase subunit SecE [Patescibacteria group bacterium]|nr:preprotein translocase subunit SecE [Patescibacteria group bacterium]
MTLPGTFLRETKDELKKVTWPSQKEVVRLTIVVIIVSVAVGLFIGGLDFIFTKLIGLIIR